MTKTTEPAAKAEAVMPGTDIPAKFDAAKLYDVQLHTPIQIGYVILSPGKAQTLKGDFCEANRASIWKATVNEWGIQDTP